MRGHALRPQWRTVVDMHACSRPSRQVLKHQRSGKVLWAVAMLLYLVVVLVVYALFTEAVYAVLLML